MFTPEIWHEIMSRADYRALSVLARVCRDFRAKCTEFARFWAEQQLGGPRGEFIILPDGKFHGYKKEGLARGDQQMELYDLGRRQMFVKVGKLRSYKIYVPSRPLRVEGAYNAIKVWDEDRGLIFEFAADVGLLFRRRALAARVYAFIREYSLEAAALELIRNELPFKIWADGVLVVAIELGDYGAGLALSGPETVVAQIIAALGPN